MDKEFRRSLSELTTPLVTLDESGPEHEPSGTLSETGSQEELPSPCLSQSVRGPGGPRLLPTFIILWCKYEPERVGECAHLFHGKQVVGRKSSSPNPLVRMVSFGMWHPRGFADGGPLTDPHISRTLLHCNWSRLGDVTISDESDQKLLRVNRRQVQEHTCQEGDVIALGNQLLLLYSHRAFELELGHELEREPPFGRPDVWGEVGESSALWQHRDRLRRQQEARREAAQTLQRDVSEVLGPESQTLEPPPLSQRREDIPLLMRTELLKQQALIQPRRLPWQAGLGWTREPFELKAVMWLVMRPPNSLWLLREQLIQMLHYQAVPMPFSLDILWLELSREERELLTALRERQFTMELVIRSHPNHFRKNRIYGEHWPNIKRTALWLAHGELERAVDLLIGQDDPELSRILIKRLKLDEERSG